MADDTADTRAQVSYLSPETLSHNPAFSQLVVVSGNARTIYVGGQDAVDATGAVVGQGDLSAQVKQVLHNLKAALAARRWSMWSSGTSILCRASRWKWASPRFSSPRAGSSTRPRSPASSWRHWLIPPIWSRSTR